MKKSLLLMAMIAMILTSCNEGKFKVDGKITGATDSTLLVLEESSNGNWFVVDTVAVKTDGTFSVNAPAPEYPNIYRLRTTGEVICFPIDSLDHITVNTKLSAFSTEYTLSGSAHAEQVMKIDKEAIALSGEKATPQQLKDFKRKVAEQIVADPAGIVAYYAINKYLDGKPLYDPLDDDDLRIIGAVANAFYSFRPNDPRTGYLVNVLTAGQQRRRAATEGMDTIYADVASLIDIDLQDYDGVDHKLSEVAAKNRLVLLNFTMYQADYSPMFNKLLNDVYNKYKAQGLVIYQISLDNDAVAWRQAAQNLPWITVYDHNGVSSVNVGAYQVTGVPTTFVIKNGEIVERVEDGNRIDAAVARSL